MLFVGSMFFWGCDRDRTVTTRQHALDSMPPYGMRHGASLLLSLPRKFSPAAPSEHGAEPVWHNELSRAATENGWTQEWWSCYVMGLSRTGRIQNSNFNPNIVYMIYIYMCVCVYNRIYGLYMYVDIYIYAIYNITYWSWDFGHCCACKSTAAWRRLYLLLGSSISPERLARGKSNK